MGERAITFDLLRILAADDKEIRINGTSTTLFLSLRLVQGQVKNSGRERITRSEFVGAHLHSTEHKFGRENLIFPSFDFDFKETRKLRSQIDDTAFGSLSDHLIRKECRVRVARVISKWTAPQGNLI